MWCHILLYGFPVLGLSLFWLVPMPLALGLYLPLSALSVWIGAVTVQALAAPASTGAEGMRGQRGRVEAADGRTALVRVGGELWKAASPRALVPGQTVTVVGIDGLTLRVHPLEGDASRG